MRKIVFVNQAAGYLTIDIINAFCPHFDKVALISGIIREQDVPLNKKVAWSKINLYNRGNPAKKFLSWAIATIRIFFLLLTKYRKYEIFYITIPPFPYLLSIFLPNRFSVLVFDVYPDVLKIYNIKDTHWFYRLWVKWNRKVFKKAHRIYTIVDGMANLLSSYINKDKIHVIHNWSGLTDIKPIAKSENYFLSALGLQGKFIVQYAGNIGFTHNVELLVEVANNLHAEQDIFFLIVGRGEKVDFVQSIIEKYELKNCKILPFQQDHLLNDLLASADLGVIILDERISQVSLPSKIYNLQNVGIPLLCLASNNSEIKKHVDLFQNGRCFKQDDIQGIAQFIKELKSNNEFHKEMSAKSKQAAILFTSENAKIYYDLYL